MDFKNYIPLMAAMLGVASGRVVRSFEIQVAKATNGQKNPALRRRVGPDAKNQVNINRLKLNFA